MERADYGKFSPQQPPFEDYSHPFGAFTADTGNNDQVTYMNVSTCPDCGGGMVKQGVCFSCQTCGYGSCSM